MKLSDNIFKYPLLLIVLFLTSCSDTSVGPDTSPHTWPTSLPEAQGINSHMLELAFAQAENRGFVDGMLVIRNGYLVAERYYNEYGVDIAHNVKSVSKSFLSALTGITLRDGYLASLNLKMLNFFPEYVHDSLDQRKHNITLRHLLMMRAGIEDERNNYSQIYNSSNWIRTTIDFPLSYDPGSTFSYNTFQTHLLSAIITKAGGMSTKDLIEEKLLEKLNIELADWMQGPQGYYFGGNNMYFTPRDMAKLGYLYMNNGRLNGEQIVPEVWVEESLTNYTNFNGAEWGDLHNINYGYLWWLGEINNYEVFLATGYGGQFIINFPALNLIVVTTSESHLDWDTADQHERSVINIVADYIVPAVN